MEDLVISPPFWRGRRVLLTGHTGFKGAWTALVLRSMGAEITGLSLPPADPRGLFVVADLEGDVDHRIGDIRDARLLQDVVEEAQPEIVIHMAAQSLVRRSYVEPVETYTTNVIGTVNLLEAVRFWPCVKAVLVVTSDKCYENAGRPWSYRESDRLGGHDPYSNSKACAELVTDAYRRSFFHDPAAPRVASARAGNVIGGGDWAADRLVPDAIRAFIAGELVRIRQPEAVRPWQHVLDPVLAYLLLCERLVQNGAQFACGWNFGPSSTSEVPVETLVNGLARRWGQGASWQADPGDHPHEAAYLKLDCSKATTELGWRPRLELDAALDLTVEWYRGLHEKRNLRALTLEQIRRVAKLPVPREAMPIASG